MGTLGASRKLDYVKIVKDGPSKKAEMISTGLTFIVATLLIVFAVVPTIQTVTDINREIKKKEQVSEALKAKLEALTSLDGQYNEYKETFDDFTLIFPTSMNFSLLLANMDALVTKNGFSLSSISFSEYGGKNYSLSTKTLDPYSVRMTVKGEKTYLMNLLKSLEEMPMYPVIESLSYNTKTDQNGDTSYSILLRVYHVDNMNFYE
ncbi:MAG: hypothetical protein RBS01_03870 [Candidatus Dojkabacteria bacterium]|jgi:Tfp pilus assembly protein PilO|nr:hypothetical protein [Candidatus Dojkabacteria bacterium]